MKIDSSATGCNCYSSVAESVINEAKSCTPFDTFSIAWPTAYNIPFNALTRLLTSSAVL